MNVRITIRDVARAGGVALSTASMALKNDPRIAEATRRRIGILAEKMGYVPDPMLSSLAMYRNLRQTRKYQATIAYLNCNPNRDAFKLNATYSAFLNGAKDTALRRGYKVEEFWLHEPGMNSVRFTQILRTRSITGILLGPMPNIRTHLHQDWSSFSVVAIGHTFSRPRINYVSNNQYSSVILAMRKIRQYGYRRVGLTLFENYDKRVNHLWSAGYASGQKMFREKDRIPLLYWKQKPVGQLEQWISTHKPEVLISMRTDAFDRLKETGVQVPREIAFVELNQGVATQKVAGVDQNSNEVGASAVNFLIDMMQRSERGIPATPRTLLIDGKWVDGPTLPMRYKP